MLSGSYTWFSSKAKEMELIMTQCLSKAGFEVIKFYPGLAALCGSGDSCPMNLIVKSEYGFNIETLNEFVSSSDFEKLSGLSIETLVWLHPDIVRCINA